jgi:hypothetical protein
MTNTMGIDSYKSDVKSWNELSDKIISLVKRVDLHRYLLEYEIYSSWWASLIWFKWGQDLSSKYFAWKVKRKIQSAFGIYGG